MNGTFTGKSAYTGDYEPSGASAPSILNTAFDTSVQTSRHFTSSLSQPLDTESLFNNPVEGMVIRLNSAYTTFSPSHVLGVSDSSIFYNNSKEIEESMEIHALGKITFERIEGVVRVDYEHEKDFDTFTIITNKDYTRRPFYTQLAEIEGELIDMFPNRLFAFDFYMDDSKNPFDDTITD